MTEHTPQNDMSPTEKELFVLMKGAFHALLDELKEKGMIKRPTPQQLDTYVLLLKSSDEGSLTINTLTNLFPDRVADFVKTTETFGLNATNFPTLFMRLIISSFNTQSELLKLGLMILLSPNSKIKPTATLGKLKVQLQEKCATVEDIFKHLDIELRNAFSHQTYWFSEQKLFYCEDTSLSSPKTMELGELLIRRKKQNVVFIAFVHVFAEKAKSGFFASL